MTDARSMRVEARLSNRPGEHEVTVVTDGSEKTLASSAKPGGRGCRVNGGELLVAALATCMCNDLFREAATRNLSLRAVDVSVSAEFTREGAPGQGFGYTAIISGDAPDADLEALVRHTDAVAEIQNALRTAMPIRVNSVAVR